MDYDSPGAYPKNKLNVAVIDQSWPGMFKYNCDRCGKYPDKIVYILRGGYVQEQLCLHCAKQTTGRKYV